ncbi:SMI1/KNR4 family protein [Streptomyces sp. MK5]|uniref:SMI1/KNR4 family protein n=1 Tax=Streptomyces sp. MK5 TaxID=3064253 RepID=UPI0027417688|nr:SMI1/KNR4 family protein [Streptomyces sp. MK5]
MTVDDAIEARQVVQAWQRIQAWLQEHAPASCAALLPGAEAGQIRAVQDAVRVPIPKALTMLWRTVGGSVLRGVFLGNYDLIPLDRVADFYRARMADHEDEEIGAAEERIPLWKPEWIPVFSNHRTSQAFVLYLDATGGLLYKWSRYGENNYGTDTEELDSLSSYLEEVADSLEYPAMATRDKPGLVDGVLVWQSGIEPGQKDQWEPVTG